MWPGREKTDEAPPKPNAGRGARGASACRFPGAEAGLLLGPLARVSPSAAERLERGRRLRGQRGGSGAALPCCGCCPVGTCWSALPPRRLGNGLLKGPASGPAPATPGSHRRSGAVDEGAEPGTEHGGHLRRDAATAPPQETACKGSALLGWCVWFSLGGRRWGRPSWYCCLPSRFRGSWPLPPRGAEAPPAGRSPGLLLPRPAPTPPPSPPPPQPAGCARPAEPRERPALPRQLPSSEALRLGLLGEPGFFSRTEDSVHVPKKASEN